MSIEKEATYLSTSNFSLLLITSAVVLWLTHWYLSRRHLIKLASKLPGPPGLPIIGNALDLKGSSADIFSALDSNAKQFKDLYKLWIGPRLAVILKKAEDIELILSSNIHLDKSPEYDALRPWLGNGLLTSTGDIWRAHRKLIEPTFHTNILKSFVELMNKNSQITVQRFKRFSNKSFDCHEYMCEATVDILLETVMGVKNVTEPDESLKYASSVMKLNDILHLRHMKPWLKPQFFFDLTEYSKKQFKFLEIVHGLSKKIIKHKKKEFQNSKSPEDEWTIKSDDISNGKDNVTGGKVRKAFLDSLIETSFKGTDITDQEVKEQVDTILFEGHDTTGAGSSFFLSLMGIHQDVQQKICEELYQIFGDSDRPATFADTMEMKYLERCILETFRLFPPVPIIARELRQDLKLASGDYTIPAGCTVIIGIYFLHHDRDVFPDPYTFNPDHHLPEKAAGRNYYSYIPFSAGPRSCVGRKYAMLKLKILLSTLLRNFRVHSDDKESDFKLQADIILKRVEGFHIRLEPRQNLISAKA